MTHADVGETRLYEAQLSISITGIDHRVWTAYGAFDAYYESKETADSYLDGKIQTGQIADRLAPGQFFGNCAPSTPREYFFIVFQNWIHQVGREWRALVARIEEEVERYAISLSMHLLNTNSFLLKWKIFGFHPFSDPSISSLLFASLLPPQDSGGLIRLSIDIHRTLPTIQMHW
jgi:hypothetical protein